jgi:WD40 repeat protein
MLVLRGYGGRVRSLAFSADGCRLASAAGEGTALSLWDLTRPPRRSALVGHPHPVREVSFAPRGNFLVSLDDSGFGKLWDGGAAWTGLDLLTAGSYPWSCSAVGLSLDDAVVVSYADHDRYTLLHFDRARGSNSPEHVIEAPVPGLQPDNQHRRRLPITDRFLAIGCSHRRKKAYEAHLWDVVKWEVRHRLPQRAAHRDLALSPNNQTLAVAVQETITLYDAETGRSRAVLEGHSRVVTGVAFTPDSRLLASASVDGRVKLWDVASASERAAYDWKIGPVDAVALAPDGMRGACGGAKGQIVLWDVDV